MLRSITARFHFWATLCLFILDISTGRLNAYTQQGIVRTHGRHPAIIDPRTVRRRHLKEDDKKKEHKKNDEKKTDKKDVGKKNEENTDAPPMSVSTEAVWPTNSPTSSQTQTPTVTTTEAVWSITNPSTSVDPLAVPLRAFDIHLSWSDLISEANPPVDGENVGTILQNYLQSHFILDSPIKNVTLSLISSSSTITSSGDMDAWFRFDGTVFMQSTRKQEAKIGFVVWAEQRMILLDRRALQHAFTSTFAGRDIVVWKVVFNVKSDELKGAEDDGDGFNVETKTELPHNVIYIGASLIVVITITGVAAILYSRYTVTIQKRATHEEAYNDPPKYSNQRDRCTDGVPEEVVLSEDLNSSDISTSTSSKLVPPACFADAAGHSKELLFGSWRPDATE